MQELTSPCVCFFVVINHLSCISTHASLFISNRWNTNCKNCKHRSSFECNLYWLIFWMWNKKNLFIDQIYNVNFPSLIVYFWINSIIFTIFFFFVIIFDRNSLQRNNVKVFNTLHSYYKYTLYYWHTENRFRIW